MPNVVALQYYHLLQMLCILLINNLSFRPFPKPQRKAECLKALKEIALEPGMKCVGYTAQ